MGMVLSQGKPPKAFVYRRAISALLLLRASKRSSCTIPKAAVISFMWHLNPTSSTL